MHSHSNAEDFHNALTIHIHGPNFTFGPNEQVITFHSISTVNLGIEYTIKFIAQMQHIYNSYDN